MSLQKTILVAFTLLINAVLAGTQPTSDRIADALQKSSDFVPVSTPLIQRGSYLLSYDGKTRNAQWVYERLTADSLDGIVDRSSFDFIEDPLVFAQHRATKDDFKGSGFDRGHLCPAADAKVSPDAMKETFYLSNISPQKPHLNRKHWLKLEKHARDLTKVYEVVEVVSGPLYLPEQDKDGRRYVRYQVIGQNDVAVPTHFFKVILCRKAEIDKVEAFILPKEKLGQNASLEDFMVPLEKIERAAGIVFGHN